MRGEPTSPVSSRLIIFDLDGTLVDSSTDIANAVNYATGPYGLAPLSVTETIGLIGEGLTRLIEKILGPGRMHLHAEVMRRFLEHYEAHLADSTHAYPGVPETLGLLPGCRKAVVSNKRERFSRKLLAELGLLHFFDLVVGSDSVPERKPSPLPLQHAMRVLGAGPAHTAIVGDSVYDMEAGRAAGIRTIAVTYGYHDRSRLVGADILIDDFRQLESIFDAGRV
ncbi:MAG: HAD family hydrolase [Thermodesulfovibrionales bacterium]